MLSSDVAAPEAHSPVQLATPSKDASCITVWQPQHGPIGTCLAIPLSILDDQQRLELGHGLHSQSCGLRVLACICADAQLVRRPSLISISVGGRAGSDHCRGLDSCHATDGWTAAAPARTFLSATAACQLCRGMHAPFG